MDSGNGTQVSGRAGSELSLPPVSSSLLNEQLSGIEVLMVVRSLPPPISRIVFMFPNCSQTVAIQ